MEADVYVQLKENVSKKFRCHSKGNLIKCCESVDLERLSRSDNQLLEKYNKLKLDYDKICNDYNNIKEQCTQLNELLNTQKDLNLKLIKRIENTNYFSETQDNTDEIENKLLREVHGLLREKNDNLQEKIKNLEDKNFTSNNNKFSYAEAMKNTTHSFKKTPKTVPTICV